MRCGPPTARLPEENVILLGVRDVDAGTHLAMPLDQAGWQIIPLNGRLFLPGSNGQLIVTDGTPETSHVILTGAHQVGEDNFGIVPRVTMFNGIAYFAFDDGVHGKRLWRSDGTDGGTRMIGDGSGEPVSYIPIVAGATRVYYVAGRTLFATDGTTTHAVLDTEYTDATTTAPVAAGDTLFFAHDDGVYGREPWVSDGTAAGTHMIGNFKTEAVGSSRPANLVAVDEHHVGFVARDDSGHRAVWISDGTPAGTEQVMANLTGSTSAEDTIFTPYLVGAVDSTLLVRQRQEELWATGPASGEPRQLGSFSGLGRSQHGSASIDGHLYFLAGGSDGDAGQVWTMKTALSQPETLTGSRATLPVTIGTRRYAGQSGFQSGYLWALGDTLAQTRLVTTIDSNNGLAPIVAFQGALWTIGRQYADGKSDASLWRLSGSAGDATAIKRFNGGFGSPHLIAAGDFL